MQDDSILTYYTLSVTGFYYRNRNLITEEEHKYYVELLKSGNKDNYIMAEELLASKTNGVLVLDTFKEHKIDDGENYKLQS